MDWTLTIERSLASLRQIAGSLIAMARLRPDLLQPSQPSSLPRHIHAAVLSILRPAEAALRRLIVIAARDLVVALSPAERDRLAQAALPGQQTSRTGIFVNGRPARPEDLSRLGHTRSMAIPLTFSRQPKTLAPAFSLFDPLKRFGSVRQSPSQWEPRISFDLDAPPALPARQTISSDDPVNALPLCRRLAALQTALDDLPGQAQRLARWRARRLLRRSGRLSPMRPGSPPGHRANGAHPVDEVLAHCHGLAIDVVMRNDTS